MTQTMEKTQDTNNGDVQIRDGHSVSFWRSSRFMLAFLGFFGSFHQYAFRSNLSVTMVCMVNQTALKDSASEASKHVNYSMSHCGGRNISANDTNFGDDLDGEFVWDRSTQGILLGAFFWGYLVTQIPGGMLAGKIGAKLTIGIFTLLSSIATALTPLAARTHYSLIIIARVIVGFGCGMWFPGFHAFWSHWAPPLERSKLLGITYAGTQLGNIITMPLAGVLCKYGLDGGWPGIFYLLGCTGFLWSCLWLFIASDTPERHRFISHREKLHIHETLRGQGAEKETIELKNIPLKSILTSLPFWAILVMNVTSDWGSYTFMTALPTYLSDVFKLDITTTGFYAALPYIGFWLVCTFVGFPADYARSNGYLSTTLVRKICNALGNFVPAVLIIIISFLDCTQSTLAVGLLTFGVSCVGFVFCGYVINHVDIAPKYSGILFGMTNMVAAATGFVAPALNGYITEEESIRSWQIVFYICAGIFMFGAVFNIIFTSGEIQKWAVDAPLKVQNGMTEIPLNDEEHPMNGEKV